VCAEEHYGDDADDPADEIPHEAVVPMVSVVQLYAEDAPGVPFPEGCELFQVLWCPFNHGQVYERFPLPRERSVRTWASSKS
jgi:hypothetical protein